MRFKLTYLSLALLTSQAAHAVEPPINLQATPNGDSTIKWEWQAADDATHYEVYVDGNRVAETSNLFFVSTAPRVGEHSLMLKSVGIDGSSSNFSNTLKLNSQAVVSREVFSDNSPIPLAAVATGNDVGLIDPISLTLAEAIDKPGYDLVFSDEFNGNSLNPARWNAQLRWDGEFNGERYEYRVINGEDQFYVNTLSEDEEHLNTVANEYNPFEFDGSRLAIRAIRNPLKTTNETASYGALADMVSQQEFLSGALTTYDKFSRRYGMFEARIKIPSHEGTFPAFWLHHQNNAAQGTRKTEIDIMENLGHAPWYIYNSFHYFDNVTVSYNGDLTSVKPQPSGQVYSGVDYSEDYHVYAVKWEPGYIAWMIDGEVVNEVRNANADNEDLYVLLNLAMGGNWTNFPANAGGLGREFADFWPTDNDLNQFANPALEIDYVRVYAPK